MNPDFSIQEKLDDARTTLQSFELRFNMKSEDFLNLSKRGVIEETDETIVWRRLIALVNELKHAKVSQ